MLVIKNEVGCKIVGAIFDLYSGTPNRLKYWDEAVDVFVIFTPTLKSEHFLTFTRKDKVIFSPFTPFNTLNFSGKATYFKTIDFFFDGGNTRDRSKLLSRIARMKSIKTKINLHDRSAILAPTYADYVTSMNDAKIGFSNGYINSETSIITDRIAENILAKSLILYESGSELEEFLIPFRHYIPIRNAHEIVIYTQFFLKNEHWIKIITSEALEFYLKNYSSAIMWKKFVEKTLLSKSQ